LGYDVSIAASGKITNLQRICSMQNRILLTRMKSDKLSSIKRFLTIDSEVYLIQLRQVISSLKLKEFSIFSRCIYCNRAVYPIAKANIAVKLPEKVKNREELFTHCRKCGRIYWKGTHFEAMLKTLEETLSDITDTSIREFVLTDYR